MNYEADELLDMVDEWKFKLYDRLTKMTPRQRAAFWDQSAERARAMGFRVIKSRRAGTKRPAKPVRRTG